MSIEENLASAPDAGGDSGAAPVTQQQTPDDTASEQVTQSQPAQISYETETEARSMGWVPQDEWRGSKDTWRPADEFVKRGKEVLPIVRSQLDREKKKVQELEKKINETADEIKAGYDERFKRLERMNTVALQKQADQIYRSFEQQKLAAVEQGDRKEYERLNTDQRQALIDLQSGYEPEPEVEPVKKAEPQKQSLPPAVSDWMERNDTWFNKDNVLTASASAYHAQLLKDAPGLPLDQNLKKVDEFLRQKFPEKFGIEPAQQRAHAPSLEGGNRQSGSAGRAKSWSDLPPEAKQAGEKFVSQGLFGDDQKKAREDYAKEYWSQE